MRTYLAVVVTGLVIVTAVLIVKIFPRDVPSTANSSDLIAVQQAEVLDTVVSDQRQSEGEIGQLVFDDTHESQSIEDAVTSDDAIPEEEEEEVQEAESPFIGLNPQHREWDERLAAEPVDPAWAPGVEATLESIIISNEISIAVENMDIECRTTKCRVNIQYKDSDAPSEGNTEFEEAIHRMFRPVTGWPWAS
jgi:hypothetical protein